MRREIDIDGERWAVYPSGRITSYQRDEFALVFEQGSGADRVRRVTRFSPLGARRPDKALGELGESQLRYLFAQSQPAWTSPDTAYNQKTD